MMLQIAICDAERKIVDKLEKIIREYFKDGNVIALYNFFDAKTVLNCNIIFDIIFLVKKYYERALAQSRAE